MAASLYGRLTRLPQTLSVAVTTLTLVFAATSHAGAAVRAREALDAPALNGQLARAMSAAGRYSGAYVYDLTTGQTLFSQRADVARPPASVEKLYTSTTALTLLGPDAHFDTQVLGVGSLSPDGVWHGNLYLRGAGDPTFGSAAFIAGYYGAGDGASTGQLALTLRARGIQRVQGRVLGDETIFDALRGGPRTGGRYDPDLTGVLSGLAYNRGQAGGLNDLHAPAAYAALELAGTLRHLGVVVTGKSGAGVSPPAAIPLAAVPSPPLSTLLLLQNAPSDNFFAEMLVKNLGARFGGAGTTAAGAAVVRRTIAFLGIRPRVVDGSGLSRADATSPRQLVTLLSRVAAEPLGAVLRASLAVAGHTGTLHLRMRGTVASGRCQAKTGTLIGVSNLAGWCEAADGHMLEFAFLMDGIDVYSARALQDAMTVAVARYSG